VAITMETIDMTSKVPNCCGSCKYVPDNLACVGKECIIINIILLSTMPHIDIT